MVAQAVTDLPSACDSNFSSDSSQDAANCHRIATPLSRTNKPHGNPIPAMKTPSTSSRKTSAKTHKPHKASSIVSNNDMPSKRKTSKTHPKGSKSDAQRRPVSSGCSRSRSQQPRARRGPTLRSQDWAARNPPLPSPSSRSTTSVRASHCSTLPTSPGEASPPPLHASSPPTPSLHEIISTLRSAFDSLMDLARVQEAQISDQQAQISDLQSRLSALENRPSTTLSGEQHVHDCLRTTPALPSCSDQRGPPSTPDPSPCSDQRGPTPLTTCSTGIQAGFTPTTFECTLDGTSATSPASSSPDTCDSSTQVRYTRLSVPKSKDAKTSQAMQKDTTVGKTIAIQTDGQEMLRMDTWRRQLCAHKVHPDACTVPHGFFKTCPVRDSVPYEYRVPAASYGLKYAPTALIQRYPTDEKTPSPPSTSAD